MDCGYSREGSSCEMHCESGSVTGFRAILTMVRPANDSVLLRDADNSLFGLYGLCLASLL